MKLFIDLRFDSIEEAQKVLNVLKDFNIDSNVPAQNPVPEVPLHPAIQNPVPAATQNTTPEYTMPAVPPTPAIQQPNMYNPIPNVAPQPHYQQPPVTPQPQYQQPPMQQPQYQQQPPVGGVPTTGVTYSMEQISVAGAQLVEMGKRNELMAMLQNGFGVAAISQLPKERYGELATQLRAMGAKI